MRIAINCRSILKPRLTGIGRNTYHLLDCLGRIDQENSYLLYSPKGLFDFKRRLPNFPYTNFKVKQDPFGLGIKTAGAHNIYHIPSPDMVPDHTSPVVVTVHDLIYKTYPQSHTQQTLDMTQKHMEDIVKKAAKIICTSKSTQNDLHRFFDLPKSKSCVVYNGVDHNTFFMLSEDQRQQAAEALGKKGIRGPFVLSVGTIEPRKNLDGTLRAMAMLKAQDKYEGKLVVIGSSGWMTEKIMPLVDELGLRNDVLFLGYVTDEELRYCYNLTDAFVYPSFYEGFGFPIAEAFCCGAAVVTSNVSSCPEVAGHAALTVDPANVNAIAEAIRSIVEDRSLKNDLRQRALLRCQEFSFLKTAKETLKVYERVCEKK